MNVYFDPFAIGPNHAQHANEVDLIRLQCSGRVLCPECLSIQTTSNLSHLSEDLFHQYARNLLDILDQRSQCTTVRGVILPILNVITTNRPIEAKSEYDYHSILRIINQVISSDKFQPNELTLVAKLFIQISCKNVKSIPLLSRWRVIEQMLRYAQNQMNLNPIGNIQNSTIETCKFLSSLCNLISDCLSKFENYSLEQITDIVFPLSSHDDPSLHDKEFHYNCQVSCLKYMTSVLLDKCWNYLSSLDERIKSPEIRNFVVQLYQALEVCVKTAKKLRPKFIHNLDKRDLLFVTNKIIYYNTHRLFRDPIRSMLKTYIDYHITSNFHQDEEYRSFISSSGIVETNCTNAKAQADQTGSKKVIFYLLANCVALKIESKYFTNDRVKSMISLLTQEKITFEKSNTIMEAFVFLLANLGLSYRDDSLKSVMTFLESRWHDMERKEEHKKFNIQFCCHESVFFWLYEHPSFAKMVNTGSINCLFFNKSIGRVANLLKLINNNLYKNIIVRYFKEDSSAIRLIEVVIKCIKNQEPSLPEDTESFLKRLGSILICNVHNCILGNVSDFKTRLLMNMFITLVKAFDIDFALDCDIINDSIDFMQKLYHSQRDSWQETIMIMNEFLSLMIQTRNSSLMSILKAFDFNVLGYALYHVQKYDVEDELVQSIAHLLVCYNDLDYPLKYRIEDNLSISSVNLMKWMLARDDNLNMLAIEVVSKVFQRETNKSYRISVVTSLIHMVANNPKFANYPHYYELYSSILSMNEFIYNPLVTRSNIQYLRAPPSPPLSFTSADSNPFEEEQLEVNHILNQLEGGMLFENDYRIPSNLFVSQGVNDELSRADIKSWEITALDAMSSPDEE